MSGFESSADAFEESARERRKNLLSALKGCKVRKKFQHEHPESNRKVKTFVPGEFKNPAVHYRMCLRKDRYRSESEAKRMINAIHRHRKGEKLRCYFCGFCNGWHLTSSMDGLEKRKQNSKRKSQIPS